MNWLGGLLGGAAKPISEYGQSRQETAQWKHRADAIIAVAAASWRPWLARLLGWCILIHVAGSVLLLIGMVYSETSDAVWSLLATWALWMAYGRTLFDLTATLLGLYIGSRGLEKVAPAIGGPAGQALGAAAGWVTGNRAAPEVQRDDLRSHDAPLQRLDGIVVPGRAQGVAATQGWQWGARSTQRLSHARQELQDLFDWLLPRSPYDLTIGETIRSVEEQRGYVEGGQSRTMDSRHLERPAAAVDFYIIDPKTGKASMGATERELDMYREVLTILREGSEELGIPVTSGGIDWGWDFFHVELDRKHYPRGPSVLDGVPA